jgi:L-seryl-tRNA(Ser) seleniumtransferase
VGKEEIVGLLVALERFAARDDVAIAARLTQRLAQIASALASHSTLNTRLIGTDEHNPVPLLEVQVTTGTALALSQRLQQGDPPVHMGERLLDAGVLILNPQALRDEDDTVLTRCLIDASRSLA